MICLALINTSGIRRTSRAIKRRRLRSYINTTLPRSLLYNPKHVPQSITSQQVTLHIKGATGAELRSIDSIVTRTLAESRKLYGACVMNILYNRWILGPRTRFSRGTALGDSRIKSINRNVPPLLLIIEEFWRRRPCYLKRSRT